MLDPGIDGGDVDGCHHQRVGVLPVFREIVALLASSRAGQCVDVVRAGSDEGVTVPDGAQRLLREDISCRAAGTDLQARRMGIDWTRNPEDNPRQRGALAAIGPIASSSATCSGFGQARLMRASCRRQERDASLQG